MKAIKILALILLVTICLAAVAWQVVDILTLPEYVFMHVAPEGL